MKNDVSIRSVIKLDFFERIKVLFGRLVVLDTFITTDQPFERASHSCIAFVETKTAIDTWKTKPDLINPSIKEEKEIK